MKGCSLIAVSLVTLATTPVTGIARDRAQQEQARLASFPLKRIQAVLAAKKLRALLGLGNDVAISSDERTNIVFIRARPDKIQQARKILARFDVGVPNYLTIIPLKHASAASTASKLKVILTLEAIFSDDRDARVTADDRGNTIIISASEETMQHASEILRWLDVKDK